MLQTIYTHQTQKERKKKKNHQKLRIKEENSSILYS